MKNLNEFNESKKPYSIDDEDIHHKDIMELLDESINEVNTSDREIFFRAKESVKQLQNFIAEIRGLDKQSLTRVQKMQIKQTDIIVRAELKLLNISIASKDMEFLGAFQVYNVIT